mgnify:CR=1 FL=1
MYKGRLLNLEILVNVISKEKRPANKLTSLSFIRSSLYYAFATFTAFKPFGPSSTS